MSPAEVLSIVVTKMHTAWICVAADKLSQRSAVVVRTSGSRVSSRAGLERHDGTDAEAKSETEAKALVQAFMKHPPREEWPRSGAGRFLTRGRSGLPAASGSPRSKSSTTTWSRNCGQSLRAMFSDAGDRQRRNARRRYARLTICCLLEGMKPDLALGAGPPGCRTSARRSRRPASTTC